MSPITHFLASWTIAESCGKDRRERLWICLAGLAPDRVLVLELRHGIHLVLRAHVALRPAVPRRADRGDGGRDGQGPCPRLDLGDGAERRFAPSFLLNKGEPQ